MKAVTKTRGWEPYTDFDILQLGACPIEAGDALGVPSSISMSHAVSHRSKQWDLLHLSFRDFLARLMRHDPGPKEGSAWSPFQFDDGQRKSSSSSATQLLVYDCDSGISFEDIKERVTSSGYAALIVSTHSHMASKTWISRKRLLAWMAAKPDASASVFLREKGIVDEIALSAVKYPENDLSDMFNGSGKVCEILHDPCPRFRVVLFLSKPWQRCNYDCDDSAVEAYKSVYKRVALELDLPIDQSTSDLARLYFFSRHEEGAPTVAEFLCGEAINPWHDLAAEPATMVPENSIAELRLLDGVSDTDLKKLISSIEHDHRFDDRNKWCAIGAALWNVTGASDYGRQLFHEFSERWPGGYDQEETDRVWKSLRSRDERASAGIGTILHFAKTERLTREIANGRDLVPHGDVWNGHKFASRHRGSVLFVSRTGQWLRFSGVRWSVMPDTEVERLAKELSRDILLSTVEKDSEFGGLEGVGDYSKASSVHASLPRVRRIFESAKSEPGMSVADPSVFDADPFLLGVENGVVDLKKGTIRPSAPEDFISKIGHVHFDAAAEAPQFEAFLERVLPEKDVREFVQRCVGYILTGSVAEEKVFFLWGRGANGKSVFGNILACLMGDYAVSLGSALVAKNKHENEAERLKARLPGARLAQINELGQGDIWDDQKMKELASRERVSARFLHHEAFEFFPTHKLVIRGNYLPGAHDAGDGFWRRLVPIEFGVQIPEKDRVPDLDRRILETEMAGVLNWAIEGCLAWQKYGLKPPACVKAFINQYRDETDVLGQWESQHCHRVPDAATKVADLYDSYRFFCANEGLSPMSKNQFSRLLQQRGFKRAPGTSVRRLMGVQLTVFDED